MLRPTVRFDYCEWPYLASILPIDVPGKYSAKLRLIVRRNVRVRKLKWQKVVVHAMLFSNDEGISVPCQDRPNWETPNCFFHNILSCIACLIKLKPTLAAEECAGNATAHDASHHSRFCTPPDSVNAKFGPRSSLDQQPGGPRIELSETNPTISNNSIAV